MFRIPESARGTETGRFYTRWDVAADGRFIMSKRLADESASTVIVVENFLEELKARMR